MKSINNKVISLGIELGSTRIKAVLIDEKHQVIATGNYRWENQYVDGNWTYDLNDVWQGIQNAYKTLKDDVKGQYGIILKKIDSIGVSAMMHGYLVFDKNDQLLTPFRTWRNVTANQAAKLLTERFAYPIPARWSIAHLYQAILNNEKHLNDIYFQTTLAGYVHWQLTGEKVVGIGEASGMFPIDMSTHSFNHKNVETFNDIVSYRDIKWRLLDILPRVLSAGQHAGSLTNEGAKLLDPDNDLEAGIPFCPPEGDAGTGMVATNSIKPKTGNISAGTSIFGMFVLEKSLKKVHPEIDLVTTPVGDLVAMVHCNNGTSEINEWIHLFESVLNLFDTHISRDELFDKIFKEALDLETSTDDLLIYPYLSAEHITGVQEGRPMIVREMSAKLNLSSFMRAQIYSTIATLKIGMDILLNEETIKLDQVFVHGGLFEAGNVSKHILSSAIETPISTLSNTGESGAWGMAILAQYLIQGKNKTLSDYLEEDVFTTDSIDTAYPIQAINKEFNRYLEHFKKGLVLEKKAKGL